MNTLAFMVAAWCIGPAANISVYAQNAANKIDSLEKAIENAGQDTVKARGLCRLCEALRIASRYDEALKKGGEGLVLARELKDDKGVADCLNHLGSVYWARGEFGTAKEFYLKSLKIRQDLGDKPGVASCYNSLGVVFRNQGKYDRATDFYLKSMKIREEIGDKRGIAGCLNNLGVIYEKQGDYTQAQDFYYKSLKLYQDLGDKRGAGLCLNNLGVIYEKYGDYTQAQDFYYKSLKIREENGDKRGIASCLQNLGNVSVDQGDYSHGADFYLESLKIYEKIGDKYGMASCWGRLSEVYLKMGRRAEARVLARKALALAREIGHMETIRDNALILAQADSTSGDFQSALQHFQLYHQYHDSLRNNEHTKKITAMQSRYEFEKELEEKKRQEQIAAAQEAERQSREYMFQSLGIFGFLVVMILSLFVLGRLNLPRWVIKGLLYISLIMTFEFAVLLFEPLNDQYSDGLPILKMLFDTSIALGLGPLHYLAERKLTARLINKPLTDAAASKRPLDGKA
jgi:tetratricopeptide (TPR) repeat protein